MPSSRFTPYLTGAGLGVVAAVAIAVLGALLPTALPMALRLGLAAAVVAVPLLMAVQRVHQRARQQQHDAWVRQRAFAKLLAISAEAYVELDTDMRITRFAMRDAGGRFGKLGQHLGAPLWDVPGLLLSTEAVDTLRERHAAQQEVRGLPVHWMDAQHPLPRHMVFDGQPRFDDQRQWIGYWGVLRDASAEARAKQDLVASEVRYHQLFRSIPNALVVHRAGYIIDANPAAVALLGASDLHTLIGQDLVGYFAAGDSRERLWTELQAVVKRAVGSTGPVSDHQLNMPHGEVLDVRISHVQIDTADGPATLTIHIDDSERLRAEHAVVQSERLLSRVVETYPDVISLTELGSGRYHMINETFERVFGYARSEVIGRTVLELAVWVDKGDRERMVHSLREHGHVHNMVTQFRLKGGGVLNMQVSASLFQSEGRSYIITTARDVTAAEQARHEYEALLNNATLGTAMLRDGRFERVNARFADLLGRTVGTLVGMRDAEVWTTYDAQTARLSNASALARAPQAQLDLERPMARTDGGRFMARVLAKAIDPVHPERGGVIWMVEDVTQRRADEQALAKARDAAESANRAKSAFLANTSHEIRTPLNALLGLARLARDPQMEPSRRGQYIEQISDSAQALSTILTDILDLSKIEAGKLQLENEPFNLWELLDKLGQAYGALADTKGLRLSVTLADDLPVNVLGDAIRVRQILSNFLNNALKFTARGRVHLRALAQPGGVVRLEVFDTGRGIRPADLPRLFHPFSQVDDSATRDVGGTGLGLSICRELAVLMGGRVGADSRWAEGSCFWAELPLPSADMQAVASEFGELAQTLLEGARVLLVEDNPVNMMIAAALLEQWGVQVAQAADGREALAAVATAPDAQRPFDAVLMDVQMPDMSGIEVTERLRERYSPQQLPIVALTAAALVSEREQALAAGMNEFVTKPIDAGVLRSALLRALRAREAPVSVS
ncbi:MAG: PAS domain S-box protein [Proteobacteria bacterium]|nr:PAS domain S-box protein [Pseudomonadota bacterium]